MILDDDYQKHIAINASGVINYVKQIQKEAQAGTLTQEFMNKKGRIADSYFKYLQLFVEDE